MGFRFWKVKNASPTQGFEHVKGYAGSDAGNMGFAANMFLVKEGDSTISKTYDIIIYWMLLGTDGYSIYPE